jgi:uncharacterized Zn finger protein
MKTYEMTYQCSQCGRVSKIINYLEYNKKLFVKHCRFCMEKTIMTILNQEENLETWDEIFYNHNAYSFFNTNYNACVVDFNKDYLIIKPR